MTYTVLVTDDDESIRTLLEHSLKRVGYHVITTDNNDDALNYIKSKQVDLVVQDIKMPDRDGVSQLGKIREIDRSIPVIIVTAYSDWNSASETCKKGAFAYIRKPFDIDKDLIDTIKRALQIKKITTRVDISYPLEKMGFILGQSPQMKKIIETILRVGSSNATCLITGESGVGKELIARALHYLSPRSSGQFVALNCAAIPPTLLESELFGYKKGAFTDATSDKKGLVQTADGGTMFLDEISELPVLLQAKMLRLLENSEYISLGESQVHKVDVRFIAATNLDLREEIKRGRFREDLFYRINALTISVPPLRERKDDIPMLAEHFLKKYTSQLKKDVSGFTKKAHNILMSYDWPGNVRELENIVQSAVALTSNEFIDEEDLSTLKEGLTYDSEANKDISAIPEGFSIESEIEKVERKYISIALKQAGGVHTQAAKLLDMSLSTFRYKAQKYNLL